MLLLRLLATCTWLAAPLLAQAANVEFTRDIAPILRRACFECHGEEKQKKGLRLDLRDAALAGGRSGALLVPGNASESLLVQHLEGTHDKKPMPPKSAKGGPLTAAEIARVRAWIDAGAPWPADTTSRPQRKHWAYEAVRAALPPEPQDAKWCRNEIDRFVLARLEHEKLAPSPEAARETLLRRVSLDLRGLPPTPEEVAEFVADAAPDAYERRVDRFLASAEYGERMAQHWLDLARYADSKGYEKDSGRSVWRWRDWVVAAFTEDLPFDRFTELQLAGDLVPGANDNTRLATAFHRNTMTNDEGGTDDEEFRVAAVVDRVNTTMQVWMGTTMACAQCHDHKYDPLSQREYYELFAFFDNTADADRDDEKPLLELPTEAERAQRERFDLVGARLEALLREAVPGLEGLDPAKAPEFEAVRNAIAHAKKQRQAVPVTTVPVLEELRGEQRRKTHVLRKGSYRTPGEAVQPGVPLVFPPLPGDVPKDRLALARWLVAPENPLTARVLANRLWELVFGIGIVETSEDFGTQGESPSHPELLDWYAGRIVRDGWSVKRALRLLVTSATYRQSATVRPELLERDPHNRLLARGPRFRLSAETVRDQALAIAGLLSKKRGGPPVMPPQPEGLWNGPYNQMTWKDATGEDRHRRALYTYWRRTTPYPSMTTFDAPDRMVCTSRRVRTNTPLQALVTLNDPVFVEAAQAFARMLAARSSEAPSAVSAWAFRRATGRAPTARELARLERLRADEEAARGANAGLAPWIAVTNVLLNLDEVLTKG